VDSDPHSTQRFKHTYTATWIFSKPFHEARIELRVRPSEPAIVLSHTCTITPTPDIVDESLDEFGNHLRDIQILSCHSQLNVVAESQVEFPPIETDLASAETRRWEKLRGAGPSTAGKFRRSRVDNELAGYVLKSFTPARPWKEAVDELAARVHRDVQHSPDAACLFRLEKDAESGRATCHDYATVLIACLKSVGILAGYVHGCLLEPGPAGSDRSHAWIRIFTSASTWKDFDPTTGQWIDQAIVLVWGRDPMLISTIQGFTRGGGTTLLTVTHRVESL